MLTIKHNIPEIKDKLNRIKLLIDQGWQQEVKDLAEKTRNLVWELTPKSKDGVDHIADGWAIHMIGGHAKAREPIMWFVYNQKTHKPTGEPLKRALLGTNKSYTLLDILEFGSRAHVIVPKNRRKNRLFDPYARLYFFWDKIGKWVYAKKVDHPGTPAKGMVRQTREKLKGWIADFVEKWKKRIEEEFLD